MRTSQFIFLLHASSCLAFSSPSSFGVSSARRQLGDVESHSLKHDGRRLSRGILSAAADEEDNNNPFGFLQGMFSNAAAAKQPEPEPKIPDVVVDADYTLAAAFAIVGISIVSVNHGVGGVLGGGFITLLASLFAVQATRIRFVFDQDCFELKTVDSAGSEDLKDSGENIVVGGANRWAYSSFMNWDFYPSVNLPILVYFKENQTPTADGKDGQIHFFPAIANVKQLEEQFELRGCARVVKD